MFICKRASANQNNTHAVAITNAISGFNASSTVSLAAKIKKRQHLNYTRTNYIHDRLGNQLNSS